MFNEHKKFPKIRGFHNVVKEVKYLMSKKGVVYILKSNIDYFACTTLIKGRGLV